MYRRAKQTSLTDECVVPLRFFQNDIQVRLFYSSILSEFKNPDLSWDDVMPDARGQSRSPLRLDVYVWPLVEQVQHGSGKLLVRQAFAPVSG